MGKIHCPIQKSLDFFQNLIRKTFKMKLREIKSFKTILPLENKVNMK